VPGLDVLRWIRLQPGFPELPVIIHSSSDQERDVAEAYSLGAQAYVVKRPTPAGLYEVVRGIKKYGWKWTSRRPIARNGWR
jgi:CheY-like chemotaxis protein